MMSGASQSSAADEPTETAEEERQLQLEMLAAEFVERCRQGETPSIARYKEQHPELADGIDELFPTIARLEGLKDLEQSSSTRRAVVGMPLRESLGDFRIVREIGRGGMGIVFEAEQVTLRRRVALKVLGANVAVTDSQLTRFRREAESAARLHHTNIVPVYGTGDDGGVHFYAMQFIDGWSLAEIIQALSESAPGRKSSTSSDLRPVDLSDCTLPLTEEARPTEGQAGLHPAQASRPTRSSIANEPAVQRFRNLRTVAGMVADLADAVAYAHSQGVLHRDIKPSNVLVDRSGVAWLADFGLAKQHDHESLTRTGHVVGTMQYMAPEQFSGEFDQRSEIHSLGLSLYELICLSPAFAETNPATIMRRKVEGPPAPLRTVVPGASRDLETVVMKACALDPAHRYQDAATFAADLRRVVDDEPILARRATPISQLARWARRHRMVAGLSVLTLVLLLSLIAAFAVGKHRTELALDEMAGQKRLAQGNLAVAVTVLDQIMENISQRGVPRTLQLDLDAGPTEFSDVAVTSADADLLNSLLQFYDKVAKDNAADLDAETARAQSRIGDIEMRLGHLDRAAEAYEKSIERFDRLQRVSASDENLVLAHAEALNQLGIVKAGAGDVPLAIDSHRKARDLLQGVAEKSPKVRFDLANTLALMGTVGWRAGIRELMAGTFLSNPEAFQPPRWPPQFPRDFPDGPPSPDAGPWPNFGPLPNPDAPSSDNPQWPGRPPGPPFHTRQGRPPGPPPNPILGAIEDLNQASMLLKALLVEDAQNPDYRLALARCDLDRWEFLQSAAFLIPRQSNPASAEESEAMLRSLAQEFPSSPRYRFELADALGRRARGFFELSGEERKSRLLEAVGIAKTLTAAYPRVSGYQNLEARSYHDLAVLLKSLGETDEAERLFENAREIQSRLAEENPTSSFYQVAWAQMLLESSNWQREKGDQKAAELSLNEALAVAERSAPSWGKDPFFRGFLAQLRRRAHAEP